MLIIKNNRHVSFNFKRGFVSKIKKLSEKNEIQPTCGNQYKLVFNLFLKKLKHENISQPCIFVNHFLAMNSFSTRNSYIKNLNLINQRDIKFSCNQETNLSRKNDSSKFYMSSVPAKLENLVNHPVSEPLTCLDYFKSHNDASSFIKNFCHDELVMRWAVGSMLSKEKRKLMRYLLEEMEKDARENWSSGGGGCSISRSKADQIFSSLDLNQDGQVTQREFRIWYNLHFMPSVVQENLSSSTFINNNNFANDNLNSSDLKVQSFDEDDQKTYLSFRQIFFILFKSSIPYIGFGFMDNFLMLLFGDMIHQHLGVVLNLTTLAAAGYGNMISCATGVVTGGFIERITYKIGLPNPCLTSDQADSKRVKNLHLLGSVIGICIGCMIGMFPLIVFNTGTRSDIVTKPHGEKL